MKKGLLLFVFLIPIFLLGDFQLIPVWLTTPTSLFVGMFLCRKWVLQNSEAYNATTKSIFIQTLRIGLFFSIWFGLYQYILVMYIQPDLLEAQIKFFEESSQFSTETPSNNIDTPALSELLKSPLPWFFSSVLINCFLFSMLGLIFGLIFKAKSKP